MEEKEFNLEQMERETEEMLRMNWLDSSNAVFTKTAGGFVSLKTGDKEYERVHVVRMFPFTDPDRYISIRTPEENSKEIGIIRDMKELPREIREMLLEQMNMRYFTPVILKINSVRDEYGFAYFDVVTDRGPVKFTINNGGNTVVHLSDTRILISDIDENRFEIPDILKLSTSERKKLDMFLSWGE